MKKKLTVILAIGMSAVLLSGCSLYRAILTAGNTPTGTVATSATPSVTTAPVTSELPDLFGNPTSESGLTQTPAQTPTNTNSTTASYLTDEEESFMQSLPTDYNKINWGVRYSPEGMKGLVISVAPAIDNLGSFFLVVAYTNLTSTPIDVSGSGYAKGKDGSDIGSVYMYVSALGSGNTYVSKVYCDDIPTGEIHWDSLRAEESSKEYSVWEADYTGSSDGYTMNVEFTISTQNEAEVGQVAVVTVDSNGDITDYGYYYPTSGGKTRSLSGKVSLHGRAASTPGGDAAVFANPVK